MPDEPQVPASPQNRASTLEPSAETKPTTGAAPCGKNAGWGMLCLGTLAGLACGITVQTTDWESVFPLPPEVTKLGGPPSVEVQEKIAQEAIRFNYKVTSAALSGFGAVLGCVFGLGVGLLRRSFLVGITCFLLATVTGAILGYLGGLTSVFVDQKLIAIIFSDQTPLAKFDLYDTLKAIAIHAVSLASVGIGVGMSVGLCNSKPRMKSAAKGILAGAGAGIVCACIYPLLVALLPLIPVESFVSDNRFSPMLDRPQLPVPMGYLSGTLWMLLMASILGCALGRTVPRQNDAS
jgi:hypothetical protein